MSTAIELQAEPLPNTSRARPGTGIMYDGLFTLGTQLSSFVFAALLGVLSARVLGPHGRGLYALPAIDAAIASSFFPGLTSATSYFLLNRKVGRGIVSPAIISSLIFVVVGSAIVLLLATIGHHLWAAPAAIASLPFTAGLTLAAGYVTGIKRIRYSVLINLAVTIFTLVIMAVGFITVARSPAVAIAAWIAGSAVISVAAFVVVMIDARRRISSERVQALEFLTYSIRVGFVSLVTLANYRADMYIVALLLSPSQLGLYAVAVAGAESLFVVTRTAAAVVAPHVGGTDRAAAAQLSARCARNVVLLAFVCCGGIALIAPFVVRVLWGPAFLGMVPALRVLLIGTFAVSMTSPISSYFTINRAKPEVPLIVAGASAVTCIVATLMLVPKVGIVGAAIGSTVAYIVGQWAAIMLFARDAKIPVRQILVPTKADVLGYLSFGRRILADSRALVRGET